MTSNLPVSHELAPLYLLCVFLLAFFAATVVVVMIASGNFLWLIVRSPELHLYRQSHISSSRPSLPLNGIVFSIA